MPALSQTLLATTSPRLETEKGLGPAEGAREAMGRVRPAGIARRPELSEAWLRRRGSRRKTLWAVVPASRDDGDRGWEWR